MIENLNGEIWKDVITDKIERDSYVGIYKVSNMGRVKKLKHTDYTGREKDEFLLSQRKDKNGYLSVTLFHNKKQKTMKVHRLVALAFIENKDNLPLVNHKDENPSNNNVYNLEWCTTHYNNNYGTRNERLSNALKGRHINIKNEFKSGKDNPMYGKHGKDNPNSRKVICLTNNKIYDSIAEASNKNSISTSAIGKCCRGEMKTAGTNLEGNKLQWMYYDDYLKCDKSKIEIITHKYIKLIDFNKKQLINIFKYKEDLIEYVKKEYGIRLLRGSINRVLNKIYKQYKGFTFEYSTIEEYEDYINNKTNNK